MAEAKPTLTLRIRNAEVTLALPTPQEFLEVAKLGYQRTPKPVSVIAPHLDELPKEWAEKALRYQLDRETQLERRKSLTPEDTAEWLGSLDGLIALIWYLLDKQYPGKFSEGDVFAALDELGDLDLEAITGQVDKAVTDVATSSDSSNSSNGKPLTRQQRRAERRNRRKLQAVQQE